MVTNILILYTPFVKRLDTAPSYPRSHQDTYDMMGDSTNTTWHPIAPWMVYFPAFG